MAYAAAPATAPLADATAPAEEQKAPPTIDSHGGKLGAPDFGAFYGLLLISLIAALAGGFLKSWRGRCLARGLSVGALALAAIVSVAAQMASGISVFIATWADPVAWGLLAGGLLACAAMEGGLTRSDRAAVRRALIFASISRTLFATLFLYVCGWAVAEASIPKLVAVAPLVVAGGVLATWVWRSAGRGARGPACVLVATSLLMASAAIGVADCEGGWTVGALLLAVSDAWLIRALFIPNAAPSAESGGRGRWLLSYLALATLLLVTG